MGYGVFVLLGTGEVGVLLSVGILFKLLVHCFVNGVNAKFVHVYFLFTSSLVFLIICFLIVYSLYQSMTFLIMHKL
jgi:hypothetical protein